MHRASMTSEGALQPLGSQKTGAKRARAASLLELGDGLLPEVQHCGVRGPDLGIRGPASQELAGELLRVGGQHVGGVLQHPPQSLQLRLIRSVAKLTLQGGDAGGVQLGL